MTSKEADSPSPRERLLALFDLEPLGEDCFRGFNAPSGHQRIFGGQVVAQALAAAAMTVPPDRPAHSLHAYFLLAGDPAAPIDFEVERLHDGRSFSTRRSAAKQGGRTILILAASFQIVEPGFDHQPEAPQVEAPETLPTTGALAERFRSFLPRAARESLAQAFALDIRLVDPSSVIGGEKAGARRQHFWFRIIGPLPDDDRLHRLLLAYLSDMTLLSTALAAHGRTVFDADLHVASLDHALWLHRPFRADEWLLFAQQSPSAAGARGFARGEVYARDGRLVASVAQEGLIRQKRP
ncbi:MAG TPA: acyl-CoA thioesterase II [Methylocystis sp.]|nr:acyl-CoA thioesterase II [Methylocystis sp.]